MSARVLFLVRHGKAEAAAPDQRDEDRVLSREGRESVLLAGIGLRRLGVHFDVILSSPLRRALETARLLGAEKAEEVLSWQELAPGLEPRELLASLTAVRDRERVALVGHEPDMGRLASHLLLGGEQRLQMPFRAGAVAAIEVDQLPPRAPGVLRWFVTPEQLVLIGS